jgi:DNA-binding transcriptional ArsR family regulator
MAGEPLDKDAFKSESCAHQLKALSEPIRIRIIDVLRHGELTVGDIAEFLQVELVIVSHHLKILKSADLVEVKRDGRYMVYSLNPDLLQNDARNCRQFLNLGCCRIEVPEKKKSQDT